MTKQRRLDKSLLRYMEQHKNKIIYYDEIHQTFPDFITTNYISVTVIRLKQAGYKIESVRRTGYIYKGDK
jgi:hypothetical protein